jgi:hypothetical protein
VLGDGEPADGDGDGDRTHARLPGVDYPFPHENLRHVSSFGRGRFEFSCEFYWFMWAECKLT